ncbi:MAG: YdeI/OmpD-associated family protein [Candidatus Saccharibacteria bacterium]|nr:YdeI/OmpD-associated family protein [Pseudorhodobacter sp.]
MDGDWPSFEAAVEPLVWGRSTYTILRLPQPVAEALNLAGAKRVAGEIAEHPVNLALIKAPVVDGVFVWAGQSLLSRTGVAPGDVVEVRLRLAPPDEVETPDDVDGALQHNGLIKAWQALTAGKRRGLLYQIETAKRPETRAKRIAALMLEMGT